MSPSPFLAICTTSEAGLTQAEATIKGLRAQGCHLLVVVREADTDSVEQVEGLTTLRRSGRFGLSAARNEGIRAAEARGLLSSASFVFFPDDDNVPTAHLLEDAERAFNEHPEAVGLVGVFAPDPDHIDTSRFPPDRRPVTRRFLEDVASSNTLYFRAETVRRLGQFDPRFGLGAPFGSAEDTDFALRAMRLGPLAYEPSLVALHPYKTGLFARNYPGNVAVKVVNGDDLGAVRLLAHGIRRALRRQLPVRSLWRGTVFAAQCWMARLTRRPA